MNSITIPPDGPLQCSIAFIGEAPGRDEEIEGKPFVGTAGYIFNGKLHRTNILRHEVYVDNVVNIRPGTLYRHQAGLGYSGLKQPKSENDFTIFWIGTRPTQALIDMKAQLYERLERVSANVIVALGNSPLWALTGKTGISKWRGSILPCTLPSGRVLKVIPTYHPAAVSREWKLGAIVECDFAKAKVQSTFPDIRLPQRELLIAPTFNDVEAFILSHDWLRVSPDIETSPSNITCIALAKTPYLSMSIPTTKHYWGSIHRLHEVLMMVEHLLTKNLPCIGQNLSFDIQYLMRIFAILPTKPWHDTMVMQHSCYPDLTGEQKDVQSSKKTMSLKTKSLAFLASIYTDEPYWKDELKVWQKGASTDEDLWRYNAKDPAVTLECADALFKEMDELDVRPIYDFMMDLMEPLIFMMMRGVKIDLEAREAHVTSMMAKLKENEAIFKEKYGEINVRSPKQILELIAKLGLKCPTKMGKPTTEKKALDKLAAKSPEFRNIIYAREAGTLLSNHLKAPVDGEDGRWRCSFNSTGASTGRLSSSRGVFGSATNLQNVKGHIRDIVIPDEGMIFSEADLKGAEAMIVAYLSEDEELIRMFAEGKNIHNYTAKIIWSHLTDADIAKDKKHWKAQGKDTESIYYKSKRTRHSGNYRIGPYTLSLDLKIPRGEAETILQSFYDRSPRLAAWHAEVSDTLKRNQQTLVTPMGRKRKFFGRYGPDLLKEAVAFVPQSTVSDILNKGLIRVYYELCSKCKCVDLLLNVHDSILVQHPAQLTLYVHERLKELMTVPLTIKGRTFSIPIEIKSGINWRDMR